VFGSKLVMLPDKSRDVQVIFVRLILWHSCRCLRFWLMARQPDDIAISVYQVDVQDVLARG